MSSFVKSVNYYKILKIASVVEEFKQQDLIYVLGIHGKRLSEYLVKLLKADYLIINRTIGRMKLYSITEIGRVYISVYEEVISYLKEIDEYIDITQTKYGDLLNENDLKNMINIIDRDYKEIKNI